MTEEKKPEQIEVEVMEHPEDRSLPLETRREVLATHGVVDDALSYQRLLDKYRVFSQFVQIVKVEAIMATAPQDWIVQAPADSGKPEDDIVMLWSPGADKAATKAPWMKFRYDKPYRVDYAAGSEIPYAYIQTGSVVLNIPGMDMVMIEGLAAGRGCDEFFKAGARGQGRDPNEIHVMQAAQSAFIRVAITRALGLRNMTRKQLAEIAGPEFAASVKTVQRRLGSKGKNKVEAGKDTATTLAQMSEAQRKLHDRVLVLLGDERREKWPAFLFAITKSDDGKFPGRRSFHDLTDNTAAYMLHKLEGKTQQEAEAFADSLTP